jgi:hypothetical protein
MANDILVKLTAALFECDLYRSLTPAARCTLAEMLAKQGKCKNGINGKMGFSAGDAASRCNIAFGSARKAFAELQTKGFIVCVKKGSYTRKDRQASIWRLTMLKCDVTGEPATIDFLDLYLARKVLSIEHLKGRRFIPEEDDLDCRIAA